MAQVEERGMSEKTGLIGAGVEDIGQGTGDLITGAEE